MKYTLIIRTITGTYVKTEHYKLKAKAYEAMAYYTNHAYVVTLMNYGIYIDTPNKWERKEYAIIRPDDFVEED